MKPSPLFDVAGLSDRGRSRPSNQDCFITAELTRTLVLGSSSLALRDGEEVVHSTQGRILAVADGISGSPGGALASAVAVDVVSHHVTNYMTWIIDRQADDGVIEQEFRRAFERCQRHLRIQAAGHGYSDSPFGTTLTVAYIVWPHLYLAHAGDSRCYLLRDRQLRRLTTDDTIAQRMVDRDILPGRRAEKTPFSHVLVNAIGGADDDLEVEFHRLELAASDRLLLCTDGLTRYVPDLELKYHLGGAVTSATCCRTLIDIANDRGGADNVTAVVVHIEA